MLKLFICYVRVVFIDIFLFKQKGTRIYVKKKNNVKGLTNMDIPVHFLTNACTYVSFAFLLDVKSMI